jgi:hypothetical protein
MGFGQIFVNINVIVFFMAARINADLSWISHRHCKLLAAPLYFDFISKPAQTLFELGRKDHA